MKKILSLFLVVCFVFQQVGFAQLAVQPGATQPGLSGPAAERFRPLHLRAVSLVDSADSLRITVDTGDAAASRQDTENTRRVMDFFLIGISLPNEAFWVNLRPDSPKDIIDPRLEKTDMGKVLLEADLQLKKDMAALTSPDTAVGRQYWNMLYARAEALFGSDAAQIPALTRPWIVPKEVIIGESRVGAYVYKATLDVMLEQDYLKSEAIFQFDDPRMKQLNEYSSELVRTLILPRLVRDVNTARRYASLRQVYYSLVLAQWFKQKSGRLASGSAGRFAARVNSGDLSGLTSKTPWSTQTYFQAYQKSFRKGEYNKQEQLHNGSSLLIRTYFSGGAVIDASPALASPNALVPVGDRVPAVISKHNRDMLVTASQAQVDIADAPAGNTGSAASAGRKRDGGLVAENDGSIKAEIERLIAGKETILIDLMKRYEETADPAVKKEIEASINGVVDLVNVFDQYPPQDLEMATVEKLEDFLASPQASAYIAQAKQALLDGTYTPEFIFAGAATRLFESVKTILEDQGLDPKNYRMYNLDLWEVVNILKANMDKVRRHNPELVPLLENTVVPSDRESLGMGARQIATYKRFIEGLAADAGLDPAQALRRQSVVLHINEEVADTVVADFIDNDFYGFDREKVFFIIQPVYGGYRLTGNGLVFEESSAKLPFGHGFVAMQLVEPGQAFTVNAHADRSYLTTSVMDYLTDVQKSQVIGEHRVNDLTKFLIDDVISLEKLAFSLMQMSKGKNIVVEAVENPGGQKGGNMMSPKAFVKKFIIETSNTSGSKELTDKIAVAAAKGAEYNAMRANAAVAAYKKILQSGIPYNLRFKNGLFYLESVKGDATQSSQADVEVVVKAGELIHDFKELKNLPEAVQFLSTAGYFNYFTPGEMIARTKERAEVLRIIEGAPELRTLWESLENSYKRKDISDWDQVYAAFIRVNQWRTDPLYAQLFPRLTAKLEQLIRSRDWETITEKFYRELGFGTAGKRGNQVEEATGEVLPGVNVINDFTVAEFAVGLARHILALDKQHPGIAERGVVIGGDTRIKSIVPYNDEEPYAHLVAKVLQSLGIKTYLFSGPRSIAEVSWYTTTVGALGMVYVSASHNYWYDNGIKSSNEFGAQLFPNEKASILQQMEPVTVKDIAALNLDRIDLRRQRADRPDKLIILGSAAEKTAGAADEDVDSAYIQLNRKYLIDPAMVKKFAPDVVSFFTPVQGAGKFTIGAILKDEEINFKNTVISKIQNEQDSQGRFDTVPKPDPAHVEDGVRTLDVAIAEAEAEENAAAAAGKPFTFDFVVGTDPDADRSAYAVRDNDGHWAVLKANDVWSLFTWYILTQKKKQGALPHNLIKTWVTSDLIKQIAQDKDFGLKVFEPAVGFDKIAQVALKEIALPQFFVNHQLGTYGKKEKDAELSLVDLVNRLKAKGERNASAETIIAEINAILRTELAFGAEESNGFSPGGHTLEKDGAVAVVLFHEIAAFVKAINDAQRTKTLGTLIADTQMRNILEEYSRREKKELNIYNLFNALYLRYGYYATANIPLQFEGLTGDRQKKDTLKRIESRAQALQAGTQQVSFGTEQAVSAVSGDVATKCNDVTFNNEEGYKFVLASGQDNWVTTRPSGTEPYIRFYTQLRVASKDLTWGTIEKAKENADKKAVQLALQAQESFRRDGGEPLDDLFAAAGVQDKSALAKDNPFRELGFEGESARLGWVIPPSWEQIKPILERAVKSKAYDGKEDFVFTGMGGSINTIKAIIRYFGRGQDRRTYALDSLDPAAAAELSEQLKGSFARSAATGVSKTTTTAEVRQLMRMLRQLFASEGVGIEKNFAWMSDPSNFAKLADGRDNDDRWPADVFTTPIQPVNEDIGGRFTAPHTFIFLLPMLLSLGMDIDQLEAVWNEYLAVQAPLVGQAQNQALAAVQQKSQYFAVVVESREMAAALENWITQLFQESLGSKLPGFHPKTVVVTKDQLKDYPEFTPVSFDIPSDSDAVRMMTTMYLCQIFIAALAHQKNINLVIQPGVQKYKERFGLGEFKPAETLSVDELVAQIKAGVGEKKFVEVVCYWYLSDAQRQELARELRAQLPGKTVLVYEGSDWNHHSYEAAPGNAETLYVVLTKDAYLTHVEGIPDQTIAENVQTLLNIAYATYATLEDKALYFSLRSTHSDLRDIRYDLTEQPTFERFQSLISRGRTPQQNNPIQGTISSPAPGSWVDLQDENSPQVLDMAKAGAGSTVAFAYSAGGLATRGGGIFHAGFAFPSELEVIGGKTFTDIKRDMAMQAHAPMVIMTSIIRLNAVAAALGVDFPSLRRQVLESGFARLVLERNGQQQTVFVYCQGLQQRLTPQDAVLDEYFKKAVAKKAQEAGEDSEEFAGYVAKLSRGIASQKGHAGQPVIFNDATLSVNPPGHFDFIRYLAISGVLGELKAAGVDFVFHSNMNNPAAQVTDYIKGAFKQQIEEARAAGREEPLSMFLLGENRGEKGGLLARVEYADGRKVTQLVEGIALTEEASREIDAAAAEGALAKKFPYFNTATFLLNVDGLIRFFGLRDDYRTTMSREQVIAAVDAVTSRMPVYMDLKEEEHDGRILVGYQLERIYGDITAVAPWVPAVIDRDTHFIPTKELADIQNSEKMAQLEKVIASGSKDGGNQGRLGGIDLRSVPLDAGVRLKAVLPHFVDEVLSSPAAVQSQAGAIKALSSGTLPQPQEIKAFLAGCCAGKRSGAALDDALASLAELLRMQEDTVCCTDPEVKEALAYISA